VETGGADLSLMTIRYGTQGGADDGAPQMGIGEQGGVPRMPA